MIERDGVSAVTHRSVAREAGVPPSSATYYYATLDDLLTATLVWAAEELCGDMLRMVSAGSRELAELLARALGEDRGRTLAEYELYLLAVRRPELRPAARRWIDLAFELARPADPVRLRTLLAAIDGLLIQGLMADEPPSVVELEPIVSFLIRARDEQPGTMGA